MITHRAPRTVTRTAARVAAVSSAVLLTLVAAPAVADTPEAWADAPHASGLDFLLVLVLIPTGIAVVITLLTVLPSLIKGDSYRPGQPWHGDSEWFGGPSKGVDAAPDQVGKTDERGGVGARF